MSIIILSNRLNSSIFPIDGTLIGTTTTGKSRPKNNDNQRVLHIP